MNADTTSVTINRQASDVFAFMANATNLDLWSFGTWHISIDDSGLVHGKSMGNGQPVLVRIESHAQQQLIDYLVGNSVDTLSARIFARVVDGNTYGADNSQCMLLMTAMRSSDMSDDRWQGLCDTHRVETRLIKSIIESGYDHRRR